MALSKSANHAGPAMLSISKELDRILSVNNYDIRLRPYFGTSKPVDVKIGIDVADINAISEVDMDYQLPRVYNSSTWSHGLQGYTDHQLLTLKRPYIFVKLGKIQDLLFII